MKRCNDCNLVYEDGLDICPSCGERLESFVETRETNTVVENTNQQRVEYREPEVENDTYEFERNEGRRLIINGAVSESSTQQYYQSKFAKITNALISGEPYQFSHTTFVTIFRIEEHVRSGYPERARDITFYGNMLSIFAVGDDLTVNASVKRNRLVAKRIYNHSLNSNVRTQLYIPALVIRLIFALAFLSLVSLIYSIANINLDNSSTSILMVIIFIIAGWLLLKRVFKRRKK